MRLDEVDKDLGSLDSKLYGNGFNYRSRLL